MLIEWYTWNKDSTRIIIFAVVILQVKQWQIYYYIMLFVIALLHCVIALCHLLHVIAIDQLQQMQLLLPEFIYICHCLMKIPALESIPKPKFYPKIAFFPEETPKKFKNTWKNNKKLLLFRVFSAVFVFYIPKISKRLTPIYQHKYFFGGVGFFIVWYCNIIIN